MILCLQWRNDDGEMMQINMQPVTFVNNALCVSALRIWKPCPVSERDIAHLASPANEFFFSTFRESESESARGHDVACEQCRDFSDAVCDCCGAKHQLCVLQRCNVHHALSDAVGARTRLVCPDRCTMARRAGRLRYGVVLLLRSCVNSSELLSGSLQLLKKPLSFRVTVAQAW